jgi:hypothetical protein
MEVVKAYFSRYAPPANSSIIRICRKNAIIDDSNSVNGHYVTDKHK